MVMVAMETVHVRQGNKKTFLRSIIPFCYKFVIQILPVQTFNFSAETLLRKLPNKKVSIKRIKRLKYISDCHLNFCLYMNF